MSFTDISKLGFGGLGIPDVLPDAIVELQQGVLVTVDGTAASQRMVVGGMRPEDTIVAIVDLTTKVSVDVATTTLVINGFTSTLNLSGKKLLVWWYDKHAPLTQYQARVVTDGALAYWPLSDHSGVTTVRNLVGNAIGTVQGTSGGIIADVGVVPGGPTAARFAGTSWISVPDIPLTPQFSAEVWMKPEQEDVIVAFSRTTWNFYNRGGLWEVSFTWQFPGPVPRKAQFGWVAIDGAALPPDIFSVTLPYYAWYHVVGTHDGTTGRLYLNGVQVSSLATALAPDAALTYHVNIGAMDNNNNMIYRWVGQLSDVAYYPRALTASEVAAHYTLRLGN